MGLVNLGGGSFADYKEWTQTEAGKQSAAAHRAKYGDQSKSQFPVVWQPGSNWQQQLADARRSQQQTQSAPDMGTYSAGPASDSNRYYNSAGQPFGGSISFAPGTTQEQRLNGYEAYANSQGYYRPQAAPASQQPVQSPATQANTQTPFDWNAYLQNAGYRAPQPAATQPPVASAPRQTAQAQPIQPQPLGTPYAPMQAEAPAPRPQARPFSFTFGGGGGGNMASLPEDQRPPGFTATYTDPFGRLTADNPMAQRDALIQLLNQQMLPYQMGQQQGRPSFNMPDLWQQAGDMVQGGWTNPLAGLFG